MSSGVEKNEAAENKNFKIPISGISHQAQKHSQVSSGTINTNTDTSKDTDKDTVVGDRKNTPPSTPPLVNSPKYRNSNDSVAFQQAESMQTAQQHLPTVKFNSTTNTRRLSFSDNTSLIPRTPDQRNLSAFDGTPLQSPTKTPRSAKRRSTDFYNLLKTPDRNEHSNDNNDNGGANEDNVTQAKKRSLELYKLLNNEDNLAKLNTSSISKTLQRETSVFNETANNKSPPNETLRVKQSEVEIKEISENLKTRLNYAYVKIQNGWTDKPISELEKKIDNTNSTSITNSAPPNIITSSVPSSISPRKNNTTSVSNNSQSAASTLRNQNHRPRPLYIPPQTSNQPHQFQPHHNSRMRLDEFASTRVHNPKGHKRSSSAEFGHSSLSPSSSFSSVSSTQDASEALFNVLSQKTTSTSSPIKMVRKNEHSRHRSTSELDTSAETNAIISLISLSSPTKQNASANSLLTNSRSQSPSFRQNMYNNSNRIGDVSTDVDEDYKTETDVEDDDNEMKESIRTDSD
ncbi:hypothetical protein PACTADRAFT_51542 [Pachysolen tannophilus NRRL Y-2460]|uniref:Uncharacterized protein n=1 Tax=Pachysolen tannophilus NRRL Y-2460 TaxID=669874 RepID=A0A1E4TPW1_PACTA|nr:hypothetical protein PACTADRAFT_51542 [Pachysolen tannophilus NRRL Y-2460]